MKLCASQYRILILGFRNCERYVAAAPMHSEAMYPASVSIAKVYHAHWEARGRRVPGPSGHPLPASG
jgi:hypothetical protein